MVPRKGAMHTTTKLAAALPVPSQNVFSDELKSAAQYDLKMIGKKPAMITVAKTELAQSYKAQLIIDLFLYMSGATGRHIKIKGGLE